MKYKCPCCGYFTLEEKPGHYEVCPVCFWEDDPKAKEAPKIAFGANQMSLAEARKNYFEIGACEPDALKSVREPTEEEISPASRLTCVRATELWQKAGAYYVRIQANNQRYGIDLATEFDEHDTEETCYVVLLDQGFPVATCRMFKCSEGYIELGRVVVLPDYERRGLATRLLAEAEAWAKEMGYKRIVIEARTVLESFYEKRGYVLLATHPVRREPFDCVQMGKNLV